MGSQSLPTLRDLAKVGFFNLSESRKLIGEILSKLEASSKGFSAQQISNFLDACAQAANPERALKSLAELGTRHPRLIPTLLTNEQLLQRVLVVFGASSGLADFLIRNPEQLDVLGAEPALPKNATALTAALTAAILSPESGQSEVQALRIAYRRELTGIALWDLLQPFPVENVQEVAAALSDLAEAALEASLELARKQASWSGAAHWPKLTIIGMGKAGARELNYLSDVDVIFVTDDEQENDLADHDTKVQRSTWLAKQLIRNISEIDREPPLWEVDANLRPEGKSGALVRTLESHLHYYDRWAESWEFQALLKARTLAGDRELGARYEAAVAERVWKSSHRENFVESVQRMRERVTDNVPAEQLDRQLKLGTGGLRDIEFTVQLLQLVHGSADAALRVRSTLDALAVLAQRGYIGRADMEVFTADYSLLRLLEHRIQLRDLRRSHLMPTSEEELTELARASKVAGNADGLVQLWQDTRTQVRGLHERLFYRPLLTAVASLKEEDFTLSTEQAQARLAAIGYQSPGAAMKHIEVLIAGVSRRAMIMRNLLPVILQWLAQGANPDHGLLAFRRLSEDIGNKHWDIGALRDSSWATQRLCRILANSRFLSALMEQIPESGRWLHDEGEYSPRSKASQQEEATAVLQRHQGATAVAKALRMNRRREVLRVSTAFFFGLIDADQLGVTLAESTEVYLSTLLEALLEQHELNGEITAFALGRFGGEENAIASDADLILVYRAAAGADHDEVQKQAEAVAAALRETAADPVLGFTIDYDLRPEGKRGRIIRSLDSYREYYQRWFDAWEAQALLRARPIAGSSALAADFIALIDEHRYPANFPSAEVMEIRRIKARVEAERLPRGTDPSRHLKLGRGSISDVEWLIQLYQLRFAHSYPELRTTRTLDALAALEQHGFLSGAERDQLAQSWLLAVRIRNALTLWFGTPSDLLPVERSDLRGVALILGLTGTDPASRLEEQYLAATRRARRVYEKLFFASV